MTTESGISFREDSPRPPVPGGGGDADGVLEKVAKGYGITERKCCPLLAAVSSYKSQSSVSPKCDEVPTSLTTSFTEQCTSQRGFEPDGCTGNVDKFSEGVDHCQLPVADNLLCLLNDSHGVSFFRNFLRAKQVSDVLEFWLTCTGFHKVDASKCRAVALAIYKKFVVRGSERLGISSSTKQSIKDRLKSESVNQCIFDNALSEVENILRRDYYPLFVESDQYAEYLRTRSLNTSPSEGASSGFLSRHSLTHGHDVDEKQVTTDSVSNVESTSKRINTFSSADSLVCQSEQHPDEDEHKIKERRRVSPAPVGAPSSTFDSETSDPLTDGDSLSLTEGSLDRRERICLSRRVPCSKCAQTKNRPEICRFSASHGRCTSRSSNLAEKNPLQFASLLTEALSQLNTRDEDCDVMGREMFRDAASGISAGCTRFASSSESKMAAVKTALLAAAASEKEESAQSILERHVSLVWDSPDAQTPTRSANCLSPDFTKMSHHAVAASDGRMCTSMSAAPGADLVHLGSLNTDVPLTGSEMLHPLMGHCYSSNMASSWSASDHPSFRCISMSRGDAGVRTKEHHHCQPHATSGLRQEFVVGSGKGFDVHHHPAGGGNNVPAHHHHHQGACARSGANEKVMKWMLNNDHLQPSASTQSDYCLQAGSVSSGAKPLSHKSVVCKNMAKQTDGVGGTVILPAQPIIQDPSMPLLTPPDPTTQLEEARRRLQLETTTRIPPKSLLCSSSFVRTPVGFPATAAFGAQAPLLPKHSYHADSSLMFQGQQALPTQQNSGMKGFERQVTSVPVTPAQPDSTCTVVVYYLCDEPIPYSSKVHGQHITLGQFKDVLAKKGTYRYYFKRACNDFNSGFVYEEVTDDETILPLIDAKICAKVVRMH